jgi:hypothetical protein
VIAILPIDILYLTTSPIASSDSPSTLHLILLYQRLREKNG